MAQQHHDHPRREFGRDGISGLLDWDRGVRGREVSKPKPEDRTQAEAVLDALVARARGSRQRRR
ncbi:hypothetical protein M3G03_09450 [Aestuariimicrobium sp. p3-SID1156]|uniref:hypothetical protein n=1 Tax=Aestuariimicrobium sp. p3-SID1156 TaxID=2916038 RepID=UPI00223C012E|nr:hypothetical protein [Aestuariimicrobium sp. p3-SID1156]MCT1459760.1 hypothetical protein [Aestuariimicrobium sp. p3-SID1156]